MGVGCSQLYLNFNKRRIKLLSSLECAGLAFKWRDDRLCVGSIDWVRDIAPGWRAALSADRSCPTRAGLLSPREVKRGTADLPRAPRPALVEGASWRELVEGASEREGGAGSSKGSRAGTSILDVALRRSEALEASLPPHAAGFPKAHPTQPLAGPGVCAASPFWGAHL